MQKYLSIQPEVEKALKNGDPVVALESTIIAHGMPYPQNVVTARAVEEEVRNNGAIPATIAIFQGKCHVGLSEAELEGLGNAQNVWKVSLRDIPFVITQNLYGATTVAATMRIASMAGIKILVTGGIGGVHRGANKTMDISADLTEMRATNVAVVSAGVKSILDIGLTLEYLETKGISVVTVGQNEFPSFYSSKSGYDSPLRLDSPADIAKMILAKWELGLKGSVLIANPVPEGEGMNDKKIQKYINKAITAAEKNKISGKEITPFILQYIAKHTNGESLESNIALIKNNARLGARIAVALANK